MSSDNRKPDFYRVVRDVREVRHYWGRTPSMPLGECTWLQARVHAFLFSILDVAEAVQVMSGDVYDIGHLRAKAAQVAKLFGAVHEHNACWHSGCGPCGACKALAEYADETGTPFDGRYAEWGAP